MDELKCIQFLTFAARRSRERRRANYPGPEAARALIISFCQLFHYQQCADPWHDRTACLLGILQRVNASSKI